MIIAAINILAQGDTGDSSLVRIVMAIFFLLFGLLAFAFWLWNLIDCLKHEPATGGNEKVIWIVVIALLGWLGAALYFFIRRPKRLALSRN